MFSPFSIISAFHFREVRFLPWNLSRLLLNMLNKTNSLFILARVMNKDYNGALNYAMLVFSDVTFFFEWPWCVAQCTGTGTIPLGIRNFGGYFSIFCYFTTWSYRLAAVVNHNRKALFHYTWGIDVSSATQTLLLYNNNNSTCASTCWDWIYESSLPIPLPFVPALFQYAKV